MFIPFFPVLVYFPWNPQCWVLSTARSPAHSLLFLARVYFLDWLAELIVLSVLPPFHAVTPLEVNFTYHQFETDRSSHLVLTLEWNKALNSLFLYFKEKLVCICVFLRFCDFISYILYFHVLIWFYTFFVASWSFLMSRKVKHVKCNSHVLCFKLVVRVNPSFH